MVAAALRAGEGQFERDVGEIGRRRWQMHHAVDPAMIDHRSLTGEVDRLAGEDRHPELSFC